MASTVEDPRKVGKLYEDQQHQFDKNCFDVISPTSSFSSSSTFSSDGESPKFGLVFQPPSFNKSSTASEAARTKKDLLESAVAATTTETKDGGLPELSRIVAPPTPQQSHHASSQSPSNPRLRHLPHRLPELDEVRATGSMYVGPTRESNWVILDRLMVGAYPSSFDDTENEQILRSILECGITTFVCLQLEYLHGVPEHQWRNGVSLRPYIEDALEICEAERANNTIVNPEHLKFLHHGIVDCGTTTDLTVLELALDICWRMVADEVVYLHCWGGHGRTGTVVAVTLGLMYGCASHEALNRTQTYHDLRVCPLNVPSPQTPQQRRQVERILDAVHRGDYANVVPPLPIVRPMSPQAQAPSPRFVKMIKRRNSDEDSWGV